MEEIKGNLTGQEKQLTKAELFKVKLENIDSSEKLNEFVEKKALSVESGANNLIDGGSKTLENRLNSLGASGSVEKGKGLLADVHEKIKNLASRAAEGIRRYGLASIMSASIIASSPVLGAAQTSQETATTERVVQQPVKEKIYTNYQEYQGAMQAYGDSLQLHNESMKELAEERARVSGNIANFSAFSSPSQMASAIGNLIGGNLFFSSAGSGNASPQFKASAEKLTDWQKESRAKETLSGKIAPIGSVKVGDPDFSEDYWIIDVTKPGFAGETERKARINKLNLLRKAKNEYRSNARKEGRVPDQKKLDEFDRQMQEFGKRTYYSSVDIFKEPTEKPVYQVPVVQPQVEVTREQKEAAEKIKKEIKKEQEELKSLGLYDGEIDGIAGKKMEEARDEFSKQRVIRIPKDGAVSEEFAIKEKKKEVTPDGQPKFPTKLTFRKKEVYDGGYRYDVFDPARANQGWMPIAGSIYEKGVTAKRNGEDIEVFEVNREKPPK